MVRQASCSHKAAITGPPSAKPAFLRTLDVGWHLKNGGLISFLRFCEGDKGVNTVKFQLQHPKKPTPQAEVSLHKPAIARKWEVSTADTTDGIQVNPLK